MTNATPERRRGRQLPTAEELRVWRDFVETVEALNSRLASRLQLDSSLSPGDYAVLLALSEAPDRDLRSSELAASIGWERSRLSHHLGRMQRRGLIHREECATVPRGTEVVLTPAGAEAFQRSTVPHLRAIRELFVDALTPDQLHAAGEIAAALRRSSRRVTRAESGRTPNAGRRQVAPQRRHPRDVGRCADARGCRGCEGKSGSAHRAGGGAGRAGAGALEAELGAGSRTDWPL